jgi:hypothetical protein
MLLQLPVEPVNFNMYVQWTETFTRSKIHEVDRMCLFMQSNKGPPVGKATASAAEHDGG